MLFTFKVVLLIGSLLVTGTLGLSLVMNLKDAFASPYRWRASGVVVEVKAAPPGDESRVPSAGPGIVVELKDPAGQLKRETYRSFNSGGRTEFAGKSVGDKVDFDLTLEQSVPGAVKSFRFTDVGTVHILFGAILLVIGLLLRFL
ncbi:MAG: hypothetical protein FJ090_16430 [Deltaproteobacteria bacterium]|uniref:Uncharacterized protein n=1 Tax=Candidatus Tanganyikabacteria bacterium TaxID=2961651 RepID=A0A937X966_9BACT|nr:hypothetical protein [Candidatus Tanganyikabacteria bacterium]MBM4392711.1 hypothetical protein [Deltaproteobacteria bacterium]